MAGFDGTCWKQRAPGHCSLPSAKSGARFGDANLDLAEFCQPGLKAGQAGAAAPQTFQGFPACGKSRSGMANPHLRQHWGARSDLPGCSWALAALHQHNKDGFVCSTMGTSVGLDSAVFAVAHCSVGEDGWL